MFGIYLASNNELFIWYGSNYLSLKMFEMTFGYSMSLLLEINLFKHLQTKVLSFKCFTFPGGVCPLTDLQRWSKVVLEIDVLRSSLLFFATFVATCHSLDKPNIYIYIYMYTYIYIGKPCIYTYI